MIRAHSPQWLPRLLPRARMAGLVRLAKYVGVWTPSGATDEDRRRLAVRVAAAIQGGATRRGTR